MSESRLSYRFENLPVVLPYHRRADNELQVGDLVYYGPCPEFYGIGEITSMVENYCIVDFRGTGLYGVFKDAFETKYLIPIHKRNLAHLLQQI
jgi:hypothetical protein